MAYRNKEACLREAERLGLDVSDMTWPELQKAVSKALAIEELKGVHNPDTSTPGKKKSDWDGDVTERYLGATVLLSPELKPERYRLLKYDEILGDDYDVEERRFDIDGNDNVYDISGGSVDYDNVIDSFHDYTTGTYRLKKRKDRKVIAMSSVPKENSGMYIRPGIDPAVVVTWQGRVGYLWKHWRYPNVKALLQESGYYQDYKHLFKDEPNVWYAKGQLVCDPNLVMKVLREIEQRAQEEAEEKQAKRMRLGLDKGGFTW